MSKPQISVNAIPEDVRQNYAPSSYDLDERIARYKAWWPLPDGATGAEADDARKKRERNPSRLSSDYYDLVSPVYERGWGKQFHYCPMLSGKTIKESLTEYELEVGRLVGLKEGMKVLDLGCGLGAPARNMVKEFGCKVTGITNNSWHVERGSQLNAAAGLQDQIEIVEGDFHKLPFADNTFDAAYSIEALCYTSDVTVPFSEIHRVLKPGSMFGCTNFAMTQAFDPSIERHRRIRDQIERGNGIAKMPLISDFRNGLEKSRFQVTLEEQFEGRSKAGPWYYPLFGQVWYTRCWRDFSKTLSMEPKIVVPSRDIWYRILVASNLVPHGLPAVFDVMKACTAGVANGGVEGIFTPLAVHISRTVK